MKAWLNGRILSESEARVSVLDHGFLYGDGVYETIRVFQGRPFFLEEHLKRLKASCRLIHLSLPWSPRALTSAVHRILSANKLKESVIRLQVSRGPGPIGFDTRQCKSPSLVILQRSFVPYPTSLYERGVLVAVVSTRRNHPRCLPPQAKSTNCLNGILAKREANRAGAFEGLMLNLNNDLAEGTVSNIFIVKDQRLLTPPIDSGLLSGVTRAVMIRLARRSEFGLRETRLTLRDLAQAKEVFMTNSLFGVMPVTRLKLPRLKKVGTGRVGEVTQRLIRDYRHLTEHV